VARTTHALLRPRLPAAASHLGSVFHACPLLGTAGNEEEGTMRLNSCG
jgi:hypothetical protein